MRSEPTADDVAPGWGWALAAFLTALAIGAGFDFVPQPAESRAGTEVEVVNDTTGPERTSTTRVRRAPIERHGWSAVGMFGAPALFAALGMITRRSDWARLGRGLSAGLLFTWVLTGGLYFLLPLAYVVSAVLMLVAAVKAGPRPKVPG